MCCLCAQCTHRRVHFAMRPVQKDVCAELANAPVPQRKDDYNIELSPAASYFYKRRARCCVCQDASSKLSLCKRCFGVAYCSKCMTTHPKDKCDASILEQCCLGLVSDMAARRPRNPLKSLVDLGFPRKIDFFYLSRG